MLRKHVPDLDLLESPLISANPFGSILGVVPGSALAERIFNDPQSWGTEDDDEDDPEDFKGAMAWLADEVGKYDGDELGLSPVDRDVDIMLKPFTERFKLVTTSGSDKDARWEGVLQEDSLKPRLLPLFEHTSLDLSLNLDLRLSKIWDSGGNMFHSFPSPLSPAKEPSMTLKPPSATDHTRLAVPPALDLASVESGLSPIMSPATVTSTSTTWSILEWYGVHPGTPRMSARASLLNHYPPTPSQPIPPVPPVPQIPTSLLRTPSSPSANATVVSPPSLPQPPRKATPPTPESTPLRRLPVIPDPMRNTPSPTPTPAATPPRVKLPERTPRESATLPPPTIAASEPFYPSPNATPVRSGSLSYRSPPLGPRPRSSAGSAKQRQGSGRVSPSPVTIALAPVPTRARARKLTPSPSLRLGMPA
ncbi:hypothetical protein D9615_007636 [Tricholomella constricta]|uniref:Uncharacterized protein n=1 Tax=Tricholomella constricta TaxID=117010 RepID=A0A8H5M273_9AGAR|nr:hypothetical protein D9615_007636 [Tricholomella constricta]